jgi:hypothetical protein
MQIPPGESLDRCTTQSDSPLVCCFEEHTGKAIRSRVFMLTKTPQHTPTSIDKVIVYRASMETCCKTTRRLRFRDSCETTQWMITRPIHVCLAGAAGWAGSELVSASPSDGRRNCVKRPPRDDDSRAVAPVFASAPEALAHACDVFVEYTTPGRAKENILSALRAGAHVVVETSGLTDEDFADVDAVARR